MITIMTEIMGIAVLLAEMVLQVMGLARRTVVKQETRTSMAEMMVTASRIPGMSIAMVYQMDPQWKTNVAFVKEMALLAPIVKECQMGLQW